MMKQKASMFISVAIMTCALGTAQPAAHFNMSLTADGQTTEMVSGSSYTVVSQLPACTVPGLDGEALRFDGYSNYVRASLPTAALSTETLTLQVVLAAETYPMMVMDVAETTPTYATVCGNLDEDTRHGIALELSSQGDLQLRFGSVYSGGYIFTVSGNEKLPRGQWCTVTAVLDKSSNAATLYLDGRKIGSSRMSRSEIAHATTDFYIGKSAADVKAGPFLLNAFCGLIDDISIQNSVVTPQEFTASATPDFNYPLQRYTAASSKAALWRPRFHAMPSGSWTNESHGMTYSDGRFHVFFQKNANGPYMSRLHWGHISSKDLCEWHEEPIAVAPGEPYDLKGCWSGCVYEDGGDTYSLYTAVDNARATIVQSKADDVTLNGWTKQGIVINGRPSGLSDDFRDPYFFEAAGQKYIIVGTSKNGVGACTLHKLKNGQWSNNGDIFFQGGNASQHGTFWEMPTMTPMGDGRWLFTCTPLGTAVGVRTLCWVGTVGSDGHFTPDGTVQYLEMGGVSRDGYGLLSPTIYQHSEGGESKTLLLGIVPDKLPTQSNFEMGWAHNFSMPREISLAADGSIVQKPYSGLAALRSTVNTNKQLALLGSESLAPVSGRQVELLGEFTVAAGGTCGFSFLKSGDKQARLAYDADRGTLTLDLTTLDRTVNDGTYGGIYTATLPMKPGVGETLKLHVYVDGSIADIFVNDTWAFSVRIFPNDPAEVDAEVFATVQMQTKVQAWVLESPNLHPDGISPVVNSVQATSDKCYDLQGRQLTSTFRRGVCIQEGRKTWRR